jgi:hypothetical protein
MRFSALSCRKSAEDRFPAAPPRTFYVRFLPIRRISIPPEKRLSNDLPGPPMRGWLHTRAV